MMKTLVLIAAILLHLPVFSQLIKVREPVRFLALGDSYTIGHNVGIDERWPNQLVAELERMGYDVEELRIIAQTGWTTRSLQNAINQQMPLSGYTLVSLLIGVNNQYTGGSVQDYTPDFEALLQQAIWLAGNDPRHVFVLSIPDYAYTPFGNGNPAISQEIDEFNAANRFITERFDVRYIDITPISRMGLEQPALVAGDGLHPSGLMYTLWVQEILKYMEKEVGISEDPADDGFIISTSGRQLMLRSAVHSAEFEIYDLAGHVMEQGCLAGSSENIIHLEDLPGGVYLIRIITGENRVLHKKFGLF